MSVPHATNRPRWVGNTRERVGRWLSAGSDLLFPAACAFCQTELATSADGALCESCREALVDTRPACTRCGADATAQAASGRCPRCANERLYFQSVVRLGAYKDRLRAAVLAIKSDSRRGLAMALGDLICKERLEVLTSLNAEGVVPVPMHWSRRIWRGTNSPQTLAERLARRLRLPLVDHLLVRQRRTAPQASLSRRKRRTNVRRAFQVHPHQDLPGARLLLVDDVMTTGATVNEAAKVLSRAGAEVVAVVVLARAEGIA